jgi:hypothetical protein
MAPHQQPPTTGRLIMALRKKVKTPLVFSAEAFIATRRVLRQTLALNIDSPFGREPRVRAAIAEYSELLDAMFSFLPEAKVAAAKKLVLLDGHVYDIRKYDQMAQYRLETAELLM